MNLLLIGCGKMGSAMLSGWLSKGIAKDNIVIVEKSTEQADFLMRDFGVCVVDDLSKVDPLFKPSLVMLAVKPQVMQATLEGCKIFGSDVSYISIAAGKTVSFFEDILGGSSQIIRVMPNTPAQVLRAMSVAYANSNVPEEHKAYCTTLLEAIGHVAWIDDEGLMDAVTAVSGSGPAYVFYMTQCLKEAGMKAGLEEEMALQLAKVTVQGAGELMMKSDQSVEQLRINVTSPGGTTEAALKVLMADDGIASVFEKAIAAAVTRSKELA